MPPIALPGRGDLVTPTGLPYIIGLGTFSSSQKSRSDYFGPTVATRAFAIGVIRIIPVHGHVTQMWSRDLFPSKNFSPTIIEL